MVEKSWSGFISAFFINKKSCLCRQPFFKNNSNYYLFSIFKSSKLR
jgi:hypothetical protein